MANQDDLILVISAKLDKLIQDTAESTAKVDKLKKGFSSADAKVKKAVTGWSAEMAKFGLAINGVQQAYAVLDRTVGASIRTVSSFESKMAQVNTLVTITQDNFRKMTAGVVEMSKEIPQSADLLAEGLYQVVSAGVEAGKALDFLRVAAKGAVAGNTTTEISVDALTTVINAYGLEVEKATEVSDIFFQIIALGKTTLGQLSPVLGQVIPNAVNAGISFEEVGASLAFLTKTGLQTARAATSVGRAITEMTNPTSKASKAIEELLGTTGKASLANIGFQETVFALNKAGADLSVIFGDESARAVLLLSNNMDMARDNLAQMAGYAGKTEMAFAKMMDTFDANAEILKNTLNAKMLELGVEILPILTDGIKGLNRAVGNIDGKFVIINATLIGLVMTWRAFNVQLALSSSGISTLPRLMVLVRTGIRGLSASFKSLYASMGPVGIALTALALAYDIYVLSSNDAIEATDAMTDAELRQERGSSARHKANMARIKENSAKRRDLMNMSEAEVEAAVNKYREDEEWLSVLVDSVNMLADAEAKAHEKRTAAAQKDIADQVALEAAYQSRTDNYIMNSIREIEDAERYTDQRYQLGEITTRDYIKQLQIRRDFEEEGSNAKIGLDNKIEQLGVDRFARLQQGWKAFLKGEITDYIAAQQIKMLATLGEIWATGGATGGMSLAVGLPLYGTGIAILEGAKQAINAFADGGRVDSPTLALIGEAGAEFVAPEKDFEQYSRDVLTPMIRAQVENNLNNNNNGQMIGGISEVKEAIEQLTAIASSPMTVLTGTQLQIMNARLNRGSLAR